MECLPADLGSPGQVTPKGSPVPNRGFDREATVWEATVSRATDFGSGRPLSKTHREATVWEATVWEATVSPATDFVAE